MAFIVATPQDLGRDKHSGVTLVGDFRRKGFPNNNFVKPSVPRTISPQRNPIIHAPYQPPEPPTNTRDLSPVKPLSPQKSVGSPTKSISKHSVHRSATSAPQNDRPNMQDIMNPPSPKSVRGITTPQQNGYDTMGQPDYNEDYRRSPVKVAIRNPQEKTEQEIRKFEQQFIDREEDQRRQKFEKQRQLEQMRYEQKMDMEMLQKYDPYGKPGVGAPRDDNRKQKFTEEHLNPPEQPDYRYPPDRYLPSDSDLIPPKDRQKYREEERQPLSHRMEPNNPMMAREAGLDDMPPFPSGRQSKQLQEQRDKIDHVREEIENLKRRKAEQFGDGYYSRPTSFQRNVEENHGQLTNRSPYDTARRDSYDPWGKGIGNPARDSDGNIARKLSKLGKPSQTLPTEYGEHYRSDPQYTRRENPTNYDNYSRYNNLGRVGKADKPNREPAMPTVWNYGKPGAGAPRKDSAGRVTANMKGFMAGENYLKMSEEDFERKKRNQEKYNRELEHQTVEQKRNKEDVERHLKEQTSDLVNEMKRFRVGKVNPEGNHHLPNSDITKVKMNKPMYAVQDQRRYHNTLDKLTQIKETTKYTERMKDNQQARLHFDTLDGYFHEDKPFSEKNSKKKNLNIILNNPSSHVRASDLYVKSKDWSYLDEQKSPRFASYDESPRIYARTTVDSNHTNQYDYNYKAPIHKEHNHVPPYATYGQASIN